MSDRTYPYSAWLLTRNFQLLEVELVGQGFASSAYDRTDRGRNYHVAELFLTKAEAVAFGEAKLEALAWELEKRQEGLLKRRLELQRCK